MDDRSIIGEDLEEEEYAGSYSDDNESNGGYHTMEDDEYEPSEQEIHEYCEWLGMEAEGIDKQLTWIAREALKAPLPENWKICYTEDREVYYFNVRTGESIWDHPMDAYYKALFRQEKAKLEKKRKKMRLYNDSFTILPLQDFFSDLSEVDTDNFDIPEHLLDPIDFRLYIDPVVLPTSGRTVSRHTIINNKWRDPFSREYIENRRLIPNVDKRNEVTGWLHVVTEKYFNTFLTGTCLAPLLRLIPYLIDQECEVSLNAQGKILKYFTRLFETPTTNNGTSVQHQPPVQTTKVPNELCDAMEDEVYDNNSSILNTEDEDDEHSPQHIQIQQQPNPIINQSVGCREVCHLNPDDVTLLLGSLLTMSTTSSMECLYLLLECVPSLRSATVLHSFSTEVLNVLHLSETDLLLIANSSKPKVPVSCDDYSDPNQNDDCSSENGTAEHQPHPPSDPLLHPPPSHRVRCPTNQQASNNTRDTPGSSNHGGTGSGGNSMTSTDVTLCTKNEDAKLQLRWVLLLMDYPNHLNILEKLDWQSALNIIILMMNSIQDVATQRVTLLCRLLRGLKGWPHNLKYCSDGVVKWLVEVTLMDSNPWNQILLIFDLLMNGSSDGAVEAVKRQKSLIIQSLFQATQAESSQGIQYAAMLGALLVYLGCCTLTDFTNNKLLEMSITHDLLPRLTRQQWKPKHFEQTLQHIINTIKADHQAATTLVQMSTHPVGKPIRFLLKELSKKKRQLADVKTKLEQIEISEKQLSTASLDWAILSLKRLEREFIQAAQDSNDDTEQLGIEARLNKISSKLKKLQKSKQDLIQHPHHANNLRDVLNILLSVRVKNKNQQRTMSNIHNHNMPPNTKASPSTHHHESGPPPAVGGPRSRRPLRKDRSGAGGSDGGEESPSAVAVELQNLALGTTPQALAVIQQRATNHQLTSCLLPPIV